MVLCLIGLGSNLGDRQQTLDWVCRQLAVARETRVIAHSSWHQTTPVGGPGGQPTFLNGALLLETSLEPAALFELLQRLETERGRERTVRWGSRVLDLDLLLYDQLVLATPQLTLPHPRMAWRRFVLEPAIEIAPDMVHSSTGWTIRRLLEHLDTAPRYVAVAGLPGVGKTRLAKLFARATSGKVITENATAENVTENMAAERLDPERLASTCEDPSGNAWAVELEFLDQRARLLAADSPRWFWPDRFWVSGFWFDQSLAYAETWLDPDRREAFRSRWQEARRRVVPAKLTVLLDAPVETIVEWGRRREGRSRCIDGLDIGIDDLDIGIDDLDIGIDDLDIERLEAVRRAILALADQPGHGPILRLTYDRTSQANLADQALAEVLAAVEAAES